MAQEKKDKSGENSAAGTMALNLVEGNVPKFSGDDQTYSSAKWAADIEDNAEIFQWTPQQKLIIARRSLAGTAALWLRTEKVHKTYEELKTALQKEFPDVVNIKDIHEYMSSRKKRRDESYYQYLLVMKEVGKRAKFPDYITIQYIIDGIQDSEVNKTVLYGCSSFTSLRDKLVIYEKIKTKQRTERETDREQRLRRQPEKVMPSYRRCFNCGQTNHLASNCPNGLKCFRCNQYGHIGTKCTAEVGIPWSRGGAGGGPSRSQGGPGEGRGPSQKGTVMYNKVQDRKAVKLVQLCEKSVSALIDSGSDVNLVSDELCDELEVVRIEDNLTLTGLGQSKVSSCGKFYLRICVDGQFYDEVVFHIVPRDCMPFKIILGQEFLKNVVMIMREGSVALLPDDKDDEWLARVNCVRTDLDFTCDVSSSLVREEVMRLVQNYKPQQTQEAPIQMKIILKDDIPVAQRPRRLSYAEQKIVEDQVDEWIQNGIVRVSHSEFASPLVLVKKKDGSTRVCVDYRRLNQKIMKDEFPLPIIEDLIDRLKHAKFFSVLDLKNGFFHLRISEECVPYTAFVTHHGQFEFLRAPFGLSVSPKYFMRFISIIFRELISKNVMMIFIDDIIIPADSPQEAFKRLKDVLQVASQYGLEINWKKAKLVSPEIEYLGHKIRNGEVRPSPEKIDAVMRFPEPKNVKQVQSFVGLTSYFRKYIQDYAKMASPLTDLLKKVSEFSFGEKERDAFNILKQKLTRDPVLKIYDRNLPTELHTDASSQALAAILMQKHADGHLHPVQYMSKKTNMAESKYSSYELEALAIVQGVKKFRHYLYGIHFKIVTDCKAFELTLKKKDLTPKVARWVMFLDEYDYQVVHRPGTMMKHTDALSRNPYVGIINVSLHDSIRRGQEADEELSAIRQLVLQNGEYGDFWIDNDVLFKGSEKKIVVPKAMDKEIIKRLHQNGHFSVRKMKEAIGKDYYIKNIDKKIEEVVCSCIPCLLATRKEGKQEGYLNPIDKEGTPLHTIHIDHIGPLTETRKQYNYILTVIDAFTKFVWLFPTKSTSSAEVLNKLRIHQQTFGNPVRIISDRGTAFTSKDFEEYSNEEQIQHVKITTGVPRGNGQVERIHRILIPMLTKLCIEDKSQWYKHVSRVQRALNCSYQRSINTTPFQLLMGIKMKCKEDLNIQNLLQEEVINQFNEDRDKIRQEAKLQLQKIQEENINTYNKKRKKSSKYDVDDLVAIKRTQFGPGLKLKPKYLGPYRVVKVKRNDRYDVEKLYDSTEGPTRTSTAADHMKSWPEGGDD